MPGNPAQPNYPLTLATAYKRWHGWRDKVYGRFHPNRRIRIVAQGRRGLKFHGRMHYTERAARSELFHRKPGHFDGASSDCSQYGASIGHWAGCGQFTDSDWTGTMWVKGKPVEHPVPGCFVIFGKYPGAHLGIIENKQLDVIGFGTQSGPDRNKLAVLRTYFGSVGHPGCHFIDPTR